MASLNQIAQSYIDSINKPFDFGLKERIKFTIKYWRATLIRREFERKGADRSLLQGFLMELETVDALDSCNLSIGCVARRTKLEVPRMIKFTKDTFSYVGPAKFWCKKAPTSFTESSSSEIQFGSELNHAPNIDRFRYINNRIYLYDKPLMKYIWIEGYPENPDEANEMCANGANCVSDDDEFPIGLHMLETILRGIRSAELAIITNDQEVNTQP